MSDDLTTQTRLKLAKARDEYRQALATAELLELDVLQARQAAELAAAKAERLSKVLEILDSDFIAAPAPAAPAAPVRAPAQPVAQPVPASEGSVADAVAKAQAAGDPLANRKVDDFAQEDRDAPPPSNRPAPGPACPGCGTPGSMVQSQIMVGDRGPFPAIVCTHCGHQKAMI